MSDGALRELLRSPLDDPPRRRLPRWILWMGAGIIMGALAGLAALALIDPGADRTASPGSTATTAGTDPSAENPITPLGDGLGIEALWAMMRPDHLWIAVNTPVAPGRRAGDVAAIPGADWVLTTGNGRQLQPTTQIIDPTVPGVSTLEFPWADGDDLTGATLTVRPVARVSDHQHTATVDISGLPWGGPAEPVPVRGEETVVVDAIDLKDNGGSLTWSFQGSPGVDITAGVTISYRVPGEDEDRVIVAEELLPFAFLQRTAAPPSPARSGTLSLFRLDDPDAPTFRSRWWGEEGPVDVESFGMSWRIQRYEQTGDQAVIELSDAPILRDGF